LKKCLFPIVPGGKGLNDQSPNETKKIFSIKDKIKFFWWVRVLETKSFDNFNNSKDYCKSSPIFAVLIGFLPEIRVLSIPENRTFNSLKLP
jgi:hypothetical protein